MDYNDVTQTIEALAWSAFLRINDKAVCTSLYETLSLVHPQDIMMRENERESGEDDASNAAPDGGEESESDDQEHHPDDGSEDESDNESNARSYENGQFGSL